MAGMAGMGVGTETDEVSRLVLAICHEVGSLVGAIRINAHFVDDHLSTIELAAASVEIDDLSARISSLLALVRPLLATEAPRMPGSLPEAVMMGVQDALDAYGGRSVTLSVEPCGDLPEVPGPPEIMHDLVVTLSYYAVEDARPRASVTVTAQTVDDGVAFVIEDTAPEDEELRAWREQPPRGRTLGCRVADCVLQRFGGHLEVSRVDNVTRVVLVLPTT